MESNSQLLSPSLDWSTNIHGDGDGHVAGNPVYQALGAAIWSKLTCMGRTEKDSPPSKRFLEVVKRNDGTYDVFLNDAPDRSRIPERWLPEELCARFGFCGEECDSILREVNLNGRTTLWLSS